MKAVFADTFYFLGCLNRRDENHERCLELYDQRPDIDWSLTDCISFIVMADEGRTEALTGDHHFGQAGFRALRS